MKTKKKIFEKSKKILYYSNKNRIEIVIAITHKHQAILDVLDENFSVIDFFQ